MGEIKSFGEHAGGAFSGGEHKPAAPAFPQSIYSAGRPDVVVPRRPADVHVTATTQGATDLPRPQGSMIADGAVVTAGGGEFVFKSPVTGEVSEGPTRGFGFQMPRAEARPTGRIENADTPSTVPTPQDAAATATEAQVDPRKKIKERVGILPEKFRAMHASAPVRLAVARAEHATGKRIDRRPRSVRDASISAYLDYVDEKYLGEGKEENRRRLVEHLLLRAKYVPKDADAETVRANQRESLTEWADHLAEADYPTWFKVYTADGVVGLNEYDPRNDVFTPRTRNVPGSRNTTGNFVEVNVEALRMVHDTLQQRLAGATDAAYGDPELARLSRGGNFGRLYRYALSKTDTVVNADLRKKTEGEWRTFPGGEEGLDEHSRDLATTVHGGYSNFCIAFPNHARRYLEKGDMQVYFTGDRQDELTIPRVVVCLQGDEVTEIRGVRAHEELEPGMVVPLVEKWGSLPEGMVDRQRVENVLHMERVWQRYTHGDELTTQDLRFLYQIDHNNQTLGLKTDPRIGEILERRKKQYDYAQMFNCRPDQVATEGRKVTDDSVVLLGYLSSSDFRGRKVDMPPGLRHIAGEAMLGRFRSTGNLENVSGEVHFTAEGPKNTGKLRRIGKDLSLCGSPVSSLGHIRSIGGHIFFSPTLRDTGALEHIGGYIFPEGYEESEKKQAPMVATLQRIQRAGRQKIFVPATAA